MTRMENRARPARSRRGRRDDGAVLIEAAIVLPLLFMLVFGMLEIGSALKSYSGAANAVRAGGRMASVAGNLADADRAILERIAEESAGIAEGEIEYIVIWHAAATGEMPPAGCLPAAESDPNSTSVGQTDGGMAVNAIGACNIYHRPDADEGAFDMATGNASHPADYYFGCDGAVPTKVDCNWPGSHRRTTITPRCTTPSCPTPQLPDYVGIYIKAEHDYVTGVLGDSLTITDASVNLLEPQGYKVSG